MSSRIDARCGLKQPHRIADTRKGRIQLQIQPLRVRKNNAKLLVLAGILSIPYYIWAGSDYADRMGAWGLLVFFGWITYLFVILGLVRKRLRRTSLEAEAKAERERARDS